MARVVKALPHSGIQVVCCGPDAARIAMVAHPIGPPEEPQDRQIGITVTVYSIPSRTGRARPESELSKLSP